MRIWYGALQKAKNHAELVTLANALLLGHISRELEFLEGRRICLALRQSVPSKLVTPSFPRMRAIKELFDVLELGGALVPEISKIYNADDGCLSDRSRDKYDWMLAIFRQGSEIATVCLDEIPFLKSQTDWNNFGKKLEQADPDELRTPVARLEPTEVIQAAELLIITYFRILLTDVVRLDEAKATRSFASAGQKNTEQTWLEEIRAKANRLLLDPLMDKFDGETLDDVIAMSKYAMSLWPFDERVRPVFFTHLGQLGAGLCDQTGYSQQELENHFSLDDEFRNHNLFNVKADTDSAEFLHFVQEQIGLLALQKGWALCIAEDVSPTGVSTLSRVSPDTFAPLHASARIAKPSELGLYRWGELNAKVRRLVGADRLWFVLAHELAAFQTSAPTVGGPRKAGDIGMEKAAQKVINQFYPKYPDARMVRADACIALGACGFSLKAAGRIWDNAAPEGWKTSGKPPHGMKRIASDDLLAALLRAGFKQKNTAVA